jgi:peptidoglycan hydrolase CwlO-like protein
MDNEKIYELMEKLYIEMQKGFGKVDKQFQQVDSKIDSLDNRIDSLDNRITNLENEVRKTNIVIENDIKPKIEALFDGFKQNSDKLDRIEAEVTKHDEFILKKIIK